MEEITKLVIDKIRKTDKVTFIKEWESLLKNNVFSGPTIGEYMGLASLIADSERVQQFIDILPETKKNTKYFLVIIARKKYNPSLKNDVIIRRLACKKEEILLKLQNISDSIFFTEDGEKYMIKDGIKIPFDAVSTYITVNPRSMALAAKAMTKYLIDLAYNADANYDNIENELKSFIQKYSTKTKYLDFDFDLPDILTLKADLFERIYQILPPESFFIIETRGGVHLLVDSQLAQKSNKRFYTDIINLAFCDKREDGLTPIPGTYQGGFVPILNIPKKDGK